MIINYGHREYDCGGHLNIMLFCIQGWVHIFILLF